MFQNCLQSPLCQRRNIQLNYFCIYNNCIKYCTFSRDWSSNATLADDTGDYVDVASYSDISNDQTNNAVDWYFPAIDLCEVNQWLLFENDISSNELSVSEICNIIKNKLLCEFQTEIFLQHPFIVQVF